MLGNLGSWWNGGQQGATGSPLAGYAERQRAAWNAAPVSSPLVASYTPPAYQTTPPHVDINAVIAAMNAQRAGTQQPAGAQAPVPGAIPGAEGLGELGSFERADTRSGETVGMNADRGDRTSETRGYAQGGSVEANRLSPWDSVSVDVPGDPEAARQLRMNDIGLSAKVVAAHRLGRTLRRDPYLENYAIREGRVLPAEVMRENLSTDIANRLYQAQRPNGEIGGFQQGGPVTAAALGGSNPPGPDAGYAALQPGEYVIKKDAVQAVGKRPLEKINAADDDSAEIAKEVTRRVSARNDRKPDKGKK